jgi:DNA adenine methylase
MEITPIIKWVGGKTQIIEKIIQKIPDEINDYYEPFIGGGSVLLKVLQTKKINKTIYASDINEKLINLYINIQKNPNELINQLKIFKTNYENIVDTVRNKKPKNEIESKQSKESYFYWVRNIFNKTNNIIEQSALFIFLNKTCFRGLYRESKNGYFNVPFGHYKNPSIFNEEEILNMSELIKDVHFNCCSYKDILNKKLNKNDFIYFDPPYCIENKNSFVGYSHGGFDDTEHNTLFQLCDELTLKKIKIIMSNSCVEKVNLFFTNLKKYDIEQIECSRRINSKKPDSKTMEVLIKNF